MVSTLSRGIATTYSVSPPGVCTNRRTSRAEVTPLREPAAALREKVLLELVHVREQLSLAFEVLGEADRIEAAEAEERGRAPLVKVDPHGNRRRERA